VSGSFARNKVKYLAFLRKRCNVNPRRGPFHLRSPSKILWRTVRGMLPHKSFRGACALKRFRSYEGIPPPYNRIKRRVVPEALRVLRLKPGRNFTSIGRLAQEFGWKYSDIIKKLEVKRKVRASAFYSRKKALHRIRTSAEKEMKGYDEKHKNMSKHLKRVGYGIFPRNRYPTF